VLVLIPILALVLLTAIISPLLYIALTLIVGLLAWLVGSAANSVAETFLSAAWTLAYRELAGMGLTGEEALVA
jgi:hypothetical protein